MSTEVKIGIVMVWVMTPHSIKQVGSFSNSSILVGSLTALTEAYLFFLSPSGQIIGYYLKFGLFILTHFFTGTVIGWYTVCASGSVIKL